MGVSHGCSGGSLLCIKRVHPDLIVTIEKVVHEGEHRITSCGIDQYVDIL